MSMTPDIAHRKLKSYSSTCLMKLYQGGYEPAFSELYRRFKGRFNNYLKGRIASSQDREDIIHNAFMNVIRFAHQYRGSYKFSTWFYTVAINQMRTFLKKQKHTLSINRFDETKDHKTIEIEDMRSTDRLLSGKLDVMRVIRHLKESDSDFAKIVKMRDVQGYTYKEIQAITGLKEGTVKSRLYRGRKEIREILQ